MSRWHEPNCHAPHVVVDTDADSPVCRACGASFAHSKALADGQMPLDTPQDEAPGQLNLYWPSIVPYRRPQHSGKPGKADKAGKAGNEGSTPAPPPPPYYAPRLSKDQIRLARMSAAAPWTSLSPGIIHVELNVYDRDMCPEYETTSYTWGGEDDDNAASQPVFIGNYWDVVWQTKNCCAMLQYLRPVEGFRLVWIDALCINQQDALERDQQVAKMERIYGEARRVVVYLGSDVVVPTPGVHARRQKLQDSLCPGPYSQPYRPPEERMPKAKGRRPNDSFQSYIMSNREDEPIYPDSALYPGSGLYAKRGSSSGANSGANSGSSTGARSDARASHAEQASENGKGKGKARADDVVAAVRTAPLVEYYERYGTIDFVALMRRRYFRRIWIVQELALSRQITFAVGNFEVWADALTPAALKRNHPGWRWEDTKAPWVRNMAQREIPGMDLYQIMRATAASESKDPRDRVFGVFALLGTAGRGLEPDYKVSPLHCFIGTFAHLIINLGHVEMFCSASGLAAQSPWPSWMPNYHATGWARLFRHAANVETDPEEDPFYKWWTKASSDIVTRARKAGHAPEEEYGLVQVSFEGRRMRTEEELYEDRQIHNQDWSIWPRLPSALYSTPITPYDHQYQKTVRWNDSASIDSGTGGMTLRLIHLLRFPTVPARMRGLPKHLNRPIFAVNRATSAVVGGDGAATTLYLVTDGFDLSAVCAETDHLFILDGQKETGMFLVLRQTGQRTFTMVTHVRRVWFCMRRDTWTRRSISRTYDRYSQEMSESTSVHKTRRYDTKLFLSDLQYSLSLARNKASQTLYHWCSTEDEEEHARWHTLLLSPPAKPPAVQGSDEIDYGTAPEIASPNLLLFCQGLLNEQRGTQPGVLPTYADRFSPELKPTVRDGCVELTIQPHLWDSMHASAFAPAYTQVFKEWRFEKDADAHPKAWSTSGVKLSLLRGSRTVCVRARRADIMALGVQTEGYKILASLTRAYQQTGQQELHLLRRQPQDEDRNVALSKWPKTLVDGLGIVGSTQSVTIV